jgi:hypothetical protein
MASEDVLAQIAKDVGRLQRRVHMIESLTKPQFKERIAAIFTTELSVAVVLWLDKSDSQKQLARLVSKSIDRPLGQRTMSRELRRLKSQGVLGQTKSKTFFIEESWREAGLETELRHIAKALEVKVAPRRRPSR